MLVVALIAFVALRDPIMFAVQLDDLPRVPIPKPIRIGSRAAGWVEQEVLDFIAGRPAPATQLG